MTARTVEVLVVSGVSGTSIYLDGTRIAGEKPWGGGDVVYFQHAALDDILHALRLPVDKA